MERSLRHGIDTPLYLRNICELYRVLGRLDDALVTAQRDRVVASYTVLASTGALSPQVLGLKIEVYDPVTHYQQVRDAWGGVRTPDGR